jgi:hypothetical protein
MKNIGFLLIMLLCLPVMALAQETSSLNSSGTQSIYEQPWNAVSKSPMDGYIPLCYTDGTAENYSAWQQAGNMNAVKFAWETYPVSIVGAAIYVGNGSFPVGGNILNQPFRVSVYGSDGENGMPGTLIDSISAIVSNYEWVTVTGLHAFVTSDFYIVVTQLSDSPDCIAIGIDESTPKANRSYSRNIMANQPWVLSSYQDMMINALLSTTEVGTKEYPGSELVSVAPNPTSEAVRFEFPPVIKNVSVYDGCGQNVSVENTVGLSSFSINTSSYRPGIYFARFIPIKGESVILKFVVVH